jgi:hypothetical protein
LASYAGSKADTLRLHILSFHGLGELTIKTYSLDGQGDSLWAIETAQSQFLWGNSAPLIFLLKPIWLGKNLAKWL